MTRNTRCLHCAVIHPLGGECGLAAVTERTFISRHASRRGGRNMIARFAQHPRISSGVTGRTSSSNHPCVGIG